MLKRSPCSLVERAPQDAAEIRRLTWAIRRLANLPLPDPSEPWPRKGFVILRLLPFKRSDYGKRFHSKLLRCFFGSGEGTQLSVLASLLALARMNERNGAYVVGGFAGDDTPDPGKVR
jgi:hypothetical protein